MKSSLVALAESIDTLDCTLNEKIDKLDDKLDKTQMILTDHSRILTDHNRTLTDHIRILNSHSKKLEQIENKLEKLDKLDDLEKKFTEIVKVDLPNKIEEKTHEISMQLEKLSDLLPQLATKSELERFATK